MPRVSESLNMASMFGGERRSGVEQPFAVVRAFHEELNPLLSAGGLLVLAGDGEPSSHFESDVCRRFEWRDCGHDACLSATDFISSAAKAKQVV